MKIYTPKLNISLSNKLYRVLFVVSLCTGCSTAPSWDTLNDSIGPLLDSSSQALALLDPVESLQFIHNNAERPVYKVGPNDELLITLWGNPDLWSELTVHDNVAKHSSVVQQNGAVSLPLLEDVAVSNQSIPEINNNLKNYYSRVIDTPFQIEVLLSKARSQPITLEGAFNNSGIVYIGPNQQTLGQIISAAGGFTDDTDTVNGILIRDDVRYAINYRGSQQGLNKLQNMVMQQGDILFFPSQSERVYYIFGEVTRQGAFPIPSRGISMLEGIARAWGPNVVSGDMEEIYLVRTYNNGNGPVIYELTMDEIIANEDVALLPGDRIFIPPTGLANWSRTINQIFGGTSAATQTFQTITVE